MVLYVPRVSISRTVLKAFSERLLIGARKFPAAPTSTKRSGGIRRWERARVLGRYIPQMTKSMRPNSEMHLSTAALSFSLSLTSAAPNEHFRPVTLDNSLDAFESFSRL